MSGLIVRARSGGMVKPQGDIIQRGHPLAIGLRHAYLFNRPVGTILRDVVGRSDLTYGANTVSNWGLSPLGFALQFFAEANVGAFGTSSYIPTPFTLVVFFQAGTGGILYSHDSVANNGYRLQTDGSSVFLVFGAVAQYSGLPITTGLWYMAAIAVYLGTSVGTLSVTRLGSGQISTVTDSVGLVSGAPGSITLGARGDSADTFDGRIAAAYHYDRALLAPEVAWLAREPMAFTAPAQRLFVTADAPPDAVAPLGVFDPQLAPLAWF